jgi:hypothetical protein
LEDDAFGMRRGDAPHAVGAIGRLRSEEMIGGPRPTMMSIMSTAYRIGNEVSCNAGPPPICWRVRFTTCAPAPLNPSM